MRDVETGGLLLTMGEVGGAQRFARPRSRFWWVSLTLWPTTCPAQLSLSVCCSLPCSSCPRPLPGPRPPGPFLFLRLRLARRPVGVVVVAISGTWFRHSQMMSPLRRGAGTGKSNRGGRAMRAWDVEASRRERTGTQNKAQDKKRRGGVKIRWTQNLGSSRQDQCRYRGCGGVRGALAGNQARELA